MTEEARATLREPGGVVPDHRHCGIIPPLPTTATPTPERWWGAVLSRMATGSQPFRLFLIPVILTFQDSGDVFDPTVYDGCAPAKESVITLIQNSPLIGTPNFT